ncbi:MAG TPA: carboxylating nicotinate-nucleotide diphosphorylase [Gammaproteobacteria bacterium]|nr:carboxylating nicotinate-nucleotide diphosphorylase [Gammaproteobacteria bacterium]
MNASPPQVPTEHVREDVRRALAEDVGPGDVTAALIPAEARANARVISREAAVVCGRPWFDETFAQLAEAAGETIEIEWHVHEGEPITTDQVLCHVRGPARLILTGERTALNFLQLLCGTATVTHHYATLIADTRARILDTRKTLPGLRRAQKYAVACGGGRNHRLGLYDAILIKENHILAAGSISAAVATARAASPDLPLEVEVENLGQLREALAAGAHRLLLDNMDPAALRAAVAETAGRAELEASGGIGQESLRAVAETGVDYISVGAITKHIRAVDLSMRFETLSA